jgi:hypothetical protein
MNRQQLWTDEERETLVSLWKQKYTAKYIGDKIGKNPQAVRQYVSRHKHELGLTARDFKNWKNVKDKLGAERFNEQWHGIIPCGHWMITKPWRKSNV